MASYLKTFADLVAVSIKKIDVNKEKFIFSTSGSILVSASIPFILFPFIANQISLEEVGKIGVLLALINFVSNIISSSINQNIYRYSKSLSSKNRNILYQEVFLLNFFTSLFLYTLLAFLFPLINEYFNFQKSTIWGISILTYAFFITIGWNLQVILSMALKFNYIFIGQIALFLLGPLAIAIFFLFTKEFWFIAFPISGFFYALVLAITIKKLKLLTFTNLATLNPSRHINETMKWSLSAIFHNFTLYADRWILTLFINNFGIVGVYNIMVQMLTFSLMIFDQLERVLTPMISNVNKDFLAIKNNTYKALKYISPFLCFIMYLLFISFVPFVLRIFYAEDVFFQGKFILDILLIATLFYPLQIISRGFLIRFLQIEASIYINLSSALLFIILPLINYSLNYTIDVSFIAFIRMASVSLMGILAYLMVFYFWSKK